MTTNPATLFGDALDDEFLRWRCEDNSGAFISRFVEIAKDRKNSGRNVAAKDIVHYMRGWEDERFGIDNSLISRLARFVDAGYPELKGYFRFRELDAHPKGRAA